MAAAAAAPARSAPAAAPRAGGAGGRSPRWRHAAGGGPVPAAPSTRRLARELGVDLQAVRGTGPGGRITDDDVRASAGSPRRRAPRRAARRPRAPPLPRARPSRSPPSALEPPPLAEVRAVGARRAPAALAPAAHHRRAHDAVGRADPARHPLRQRRRHRSQRARSREASRPAKQRGITLTLTSFLLKAAALALREHPQFNASLDAGAGELILKRYCHLGIAVATERGPDRAGHPRRGHEARAGASRASWRRSPSGCATGKAALDDLRGGTFTITNIGALGGTGAIPIINYPEVAILGVARGREEPVVRGGQIVARMMLPHHADLRPPRGRRRRRRALRPGHHPPPRGTGNALRRVVGIPHGDGRSGHRGGRGRAGRRARRLLGGVSLRRARARDGGRGCRASGWEARASMKAASRPRRCSTWRR